MLAAADNHSESFRHFVDKWQAREPEMVIAEVFCAMAARPRFQAWGALLHELREALFELSDPRVTAIKCSWWAEEIISLAQGGSRHPVTAEFVGSSAPWSELGRCLLEASVIEARPGTTPEAIDTLLPLARAIVSVEAVVFAAPTDEQAARALVVHWLLSRLPKGLEMEDRARIPMHLFARHGLVPGAWDAGQGAAALRDWSAELAQVLPIDTNSAMFRRAQTCFDRARLRRIAAAKGFAAPPALATLWRAWRAARAG